MSCRVTPRPYAGSMDTMPSNVIPFRRPDITGQARLPFGVPSRAVRPLDERRIAHRQRMLDFLRGQSASARCAVVARG